MLHTLEDYDDYAIHATDGNLGLVKDFYVDDRQWVVRYIIVETGSWLSSRKVLLSPASIKRMDRINRSLSVAISMDQVRQGPSIDTQKPVSREYEIDYLSYYGYPFYWGNTGLWGAYNQPSTVARNPLRQENPYHENELLDENFQSYISTRQNHVNHHLRSCHELVGYHIEARDGEIGHISGMFIDQDTWAIRYFIVSTRNWWIGNKVLISPHWISGVNWEDQKVTLNLTREQIRRSPPFDPDVPVNREQEKGLHLHYGRDGYWEDEAIYVSEVSV